MAITGGLKRTIAISLFLHAGFFTLFSFSFGRPVPAARAPAMAFRGQCLQDSQVYAAAQLSSEAVGAPITLHPALLTSRMQGHADLMQDAAVSRMRESHLRPAYALKKVEAKQTFAQPVVPVAIPERPSAPALMLYPVLPYSFTLYFGDRQAAHTELMFKIMPVGMRNTVIVKRKISSGNLEADLVSMRYINHYLFMQQDKIAPGVWHTVEIDLSARGQ